MPEPLFQKSHREQQAIRKYGLFFTKESVNQDITNTVKIVNPNYILEPFSGEGSLIGNLIGHYKGAANDINEKFVERLKEKFGSSKWLFTSKNTIISPIEELINLWKVPSNKIVLILTNPPFGTSSTNVLASKKDEIEDTKKSRQTEIEYNRLNEQFGRGDLVIPAIGKLIEILRYLKSGYLATFSPAGVLLGRKRYEKLLKSLLKDFEFIKGYIYRGQNFDGVSIKKAIAFSVWKYHKNVDTDIDTLIFSCDKRDVKLKRMPLLKNGWRYRDGSKYIREKVENPVGVFRCERFNVPNPKTFSINLKEGSGAELAPENVKIDLKIPNLPSELVYGLWSITVGYLSITDFPYYINESYTHLPDFTTQETMEILAYSFINELIFEIKNSYCGGKIGFSGIDVNRTFNFINKRLTEGVIHLITDYGYCPIGEDTISGVFEKLKNNLNFDKTYRRLIKKEIESRLHAIGYWDYLPLNEKW